MKFIHGIAITLLFSSHAFAQQDVQIDGTTLYPLKKIVPNTLKSSSPIKSIRLLNIKLSDNAWKKLDSHGVTPLAKNTSLFSRRQHFPSQVQLGMNQVPVLDQGPYGTCVIFAGTGAVDAALNQGDYISQLCQLELGQYFETVTDGSLPSGWNGSMGAMVLNQMTNFGFITKEIEKTVGCGGLTNYPTDGVNPENEMNIPDYRLLSTDMSDFTVNVVWSSVMDVYQAFLDETDREQVLDAVKDSLNHNDRLVFGVMLFLPEIGVMGAAGQHHVANDTWVITPLIDLSINAHSSDFGGHEMIITGYDDDAIATDEKGRTHKGLLTLRNSWGKGIGDAGDFYMSYDYFNRLADEVLRIRQL